MSKILYFFLLKIVVSKAAEFQDTQSSTDMNSNCGVWAELNNREECNLNPSYMWNYCRESCAEVTGISMCERQKGFGYCEAKNWNAVCQATCDNVYPVVYGNEAECPTQLVTSCASISDGPSCIDSYYTYAGSGEAPPDSLGHLTHNNCYWDNPSNECKSADVSRNIFNDQTDVYYLYNYYNPECSHLVVD